MAEGSATPGGERILLGHVEMSAEEQGAAQRLFLYSATADAPDGCALPLAVRNPSATAQ